MQKKLPALQFYFGDWKKDAELSMCSLATRGFWIELLGAMHELGRSGQITGTAQQLARVCRCTAAEATEAIHELAITRTASVSERDGIYTITNRRMKREFEERKQTAKRVAKHRKNRNVTFCNKNVTPLENVDIKEDKGDFLECNADETPYSSSSSSSNSKTVTKNMSETSSDVRRVFEFWQTELDHRNAKLDNPRKTIITARLKHFSADQLCRAITGVTKSPFHLGQNDRFTRYDDFKTIFRDAAQVEKFIELADSSNRSTVFIDPWTGKGLK